jgi:hypothetical protein
MGAVSAVFACLALSGCPSKGYLPVKGQLLWEDGRPLQELAGFEVTFSSQELKLSARGTISEDGTFTLGTDKAGDGAPPGTYVVTVTQPHRMPDRPEKRNPIVLLVYEDPDLSPLRATVSADNTDFTFKLMPVKPGRNK